MAPSLRILNIEINLRGFDEIFGADDACIPFVAHDGGDSMDEGGFSVHTAGFMCVLFLSGVEGFYFKRHCSSSRSL